MLCGMIVELPSGPAHDSGMYSTQVCARESLVSCLSETVNETVAPKWEGKDEGGIARARLDSGVWRTQRRACVSSAPKVPNELSINPKLIARARAGNKV